MSFSTRPAPHPLARANELYVTRKKPIQAYLSRAIKWTEQGKTEIIVHGLGMAIPRALDVANALRPHFKALLIKTSTQIVVDEAPEPRIRKVSAVHICLKGNSLSF
mmetsp:Transcript_32946/g.57754  ORF Transcript_32946/g.57754 Transcript_32946/m.57754 type:complete len:106 (-) Transcript_32946:84-401(-)